MHRAKMLASIARVARAPASARRRASSSRPIQRKRKSPGSPNLAAHARQRVRRIRRLETTSLGDAAFMQQGAHTARVRPTAGRSGRCNELPGRKPSSRHSCASSKRRRPTKAVACISDPYGSANSTRNSVASSIMEVAACSAREYSDARFSAHEKVSSGMSSGQTDPGRGAAALRPTEHHRAREPIRTGFRGRVACPLSEPLPWDRSRPLAEPEAPRGDSLRLPRVQALLRQRTAPTSSRPALRVIRTCCLRLRVKRKCGLFTLADVGGATAS